MWRFSVHFVFHSKPAVKHLFVSLILAVLWCRECVDVNFVYNEASLKRTNYVSNLNAYGGAKFATRGYFNAADAS